MNDERTSDGASGADLPRAQAQRLTTLRAIVRGYERAVVAFSGGVDSALVAAITAEQLGDDALAVTAQSPSLPGAELAAAVELAAAIGIRHRVVRTDELARPAYVANAGDRCFHCKSELYSHLTPIAAETGAVVCNGTNRDEPGRLPAGAGERRRRAACAARWSRRAAARPTCGRWRGTWGWRRGTSRRRPAWPVGCPWGRRCRRRCWARSRRRRRCCGGLGLRQVRVRHHGEIARIETDAAGMAIVARERETIERRLRGLGFRFVTLDLGGYRTGSLNPLGRDGAAS